MVWIFSITIVHLRDLIAGLQRCPRHLQCLAKQVKPTPTFSLLQRLLYGQPDAPDTIPWGSLYKRQVSCRNQVSCKLRVVAELEIAATFNYARSECNPPSLVPVPHFTPQPLENLRIATPFRPASHDERPRRLVSHAPGLTGHHVLLCTVKHLFDPLRDLHESGRLVELAQKGMLARFMPVEEDAAMCYGTARHSVLRFDLERYNLPVCSCCLQLEVSIQARLRHFKKAPFQSSVFIEYQRYEEPFQVLFVPFACILAMLFNELFILLATKLKALNRT